MREKGRKEALGVFIGPAAIVSDGTTPADIYAIFPVQPL
jgi:hypothetical protein